MSDAVERNHIVSQVGYHMRFGSAVRKFKEYMENGTAGKPTLYMADYECNSLHGPWWRDVSNAAVRFLSRSSICMIWGFI